MRSAIALLLLVTACDTGPKPPSEKAAERARPIDLGAPRDLAPAPLASTTISGRVGPGPSGRVLVAATDGPCFQAGTHYLATALVAAGQPYRLALFPPVGTRIEVCAALVGNGGRVTATWGRSPKGPLVPAGTTGVRFDDVDVPLAHAAPITLPPGLKVD